MSLKNLAFILLLFCFVVRAKKFTIILSPEGDSANPGRSLPDGFECGFTRQYAELLKEALEQDETIRAIMSHEVGEQVSQYEKASFANRLEADLYISINFYSSEKPSLSIYYYTSSLFEPPADSSRLELFSTTKAYALCDKQTKKMAQYWQLLNSYQAQLYINGPIPLPVKQLEGIAIPAFVLELGAQKITDVYRYVQPVSEILKKNAHEQKL